MYDRILTARLDRLLPHKSVMILGPRQVGKSTLLKSLAPDLTIDLAREREFTEHLKDPGLIERLCHALLGQGRKLILVDEIQRIPSLLNTIQSLIDDHKGLRFLLSGSSARKLTRGRANLLPGRIVAERLFPLTFWEFGKNWSEKKLQFCLVKGSLPGIVDSEIADEVLESYVDIYVREEIQAEALTKDLGDYVRFLDVAAEASGQHINYSKMASDAEINKEKIRRFTEILRDTLLIHRVEAFDLPQSKRKVRQKDRFIFFDNGVCNAILRKNRNQFTPTEMGPLFEQWILQQVIAFVSYRHKLWRISSYRDDQGLEIDLIVEAGEKILAVEIKFQATFRPDFAKNLNEFVDMAGIKERKRIKKILVYTGSSMQMTADGIEVLPYRDFLKRLEDLH